jgi:hypothetical protein
MMIVSKRIGDQVYKHPILLSLSNKYNQSEVVSDWTAVINVIDIRKVNTNLQLRNVMRDISRPETGTNVVACLCSSSQKSRIRFI